jgi:methyl-accepting chemotaxis protein
MIRLHSIRAQANVLFAILLGLMVLTAGSGWWAAEHLALALGRSDRAAELLRNHLDADMMHDALRADVLAAGMIAADAEPGRLDAIRKDTLEHAATFRARISANERLATAESRPVLKALDAPLAAYIANAESMVDLAAKDPGALPARMPAFLRDFAVLEDSMGAATDVLTKAQTLATARATALGRNAQIVLAAALVLGALIVVSLAMMAERRVIRPLLRLSTVMAELAAGRPGVQIDDQAREDEVGAMARATETFRVGAEAKAELEASTAEERRRAAEARAAADAERETAAREQADVVTALGCALGELSSGNLAGRIERDFPPAYEPLRRDFNSAVLSLAETLEHIGSGTKSLHAGADDIARASEDLSRRTEQQAASLEETAAALDQITATVGKTAAGSRKAREAVNDTMETAVKSSEVVAEAVGAMAQIESSARQISEIIGVIDQIAFQTNLLALNAGVEAARAGESGRGFAVVAAEVRELAQRSAQAAREIGALISSSGQHVARGVDLVDAAGQALQHIADQVGGIDALVSEIAASAQEQAVSLAEVNAAVGQMDRGIQQNAAMVEQSAAATHALKAETEEVARLVGQFRCTAGRPATPLREPAASARGNLALVANAGRT